jgi:hypothetical protein
MSNRLAGLSVEQSERQIKKWLPKYVFHPCHLQGKHFEI